MSNQVNGYQAPTPVSAARAFFILVTKSARLSRVFSIVAKITNSQHCSRSLQTWGRTAKVREKKSRQCQRKKTHRRLKTGPSSWKVDVAYQRFLWLHNEAWKQRTKRKRQRLKTKVSANTCLVPLPFLLF